METSLGEELRFENARNQPLPRATGIAVHGSADEIYREYAPILRRVARRKYNVPPADADALVHDVFIAYLANVGAVRSNLRAYLIVAICNASLDYWRSRRSEGRVFADGEALDSVAVHEGVFEGLAANLVVAATLARLGDRCREVLRRYYMEGDDTPTIATALGTSQPNVNYLMHVCRKQAREIYETLSRVR